MITSLREGRNPTVRDRAATLASIAARPAVERFTIVPGESAASTTIRLMDYNVPPPNIANIARAEDAARLGFRFVARPAR